MKVPTQKVLSIRAWILSGVASVSPGALTEQELREFAANRMRGEGQGEFSDLDWDTAITSLATESKIRRPATKYWRN